MEMKTLYDMKLFEKIYNRDGAFARVPGGWLFLTYETCCFIPFNNEFMEINPPCQSKNEISTLKDQLQIVVKALQQASDELGITQPGYPSPVANANEYIKQALAEIEGGK